VPAESHVHLYGEDYLVDLLDGDVWVASVSCFCATGACPSPPTEWHWHEVVRADTYRDLLVLLSARAVIDGAEAA
jgi:hypothetical protein